MDFVSSTLSKEVLTIIEQVDSSFNTNQVEKLGHGLISSLINDARIKYISEELSKNIRKQNSEIEFGLMNNFFEPEQEIVKVVTHLNPELKENNTNKLDHSRNEETIISTWNKQITTSDRHNFLIEILPNSKLFLFLLKTIICQWLSSNETGVEAITVLRGVIKYFPQEAINLMFLSLFKDKTFELITENNIYNDWISILTDSQKNKLLCWFLNDISSDKHDSDVKIIYILIERTFLSYDSIQCLLEYLLANLNQFNNDRYFENILLLIAKRLSPNTPENVMNLMLSLSSQFKGVMRFRIQNILKTVSESAEVDR